MLSRILSFFKNFSKKETLLLSTLVIFFLITLFISLYYFSPWLGISSTEPHNQVMTKGDEPSVKQDTCKEVINHSDILDFIMELACHTNRYKVVDEDSLSDHVKELILSNSRYRGWYMGSREVLWNSSRKKHNRLDGYFDNWGYSPSHSPLVESASD